jgi:hypothetical protein
LVVSGLTLEVLEEAIELFAIENDAGALVHRHQQRTPLRVEGAALHANVGDRFGVAEPPLHVERPLTLRFGRANGRSEHLSRRPRQVE